MEKKQVSGSGPVQVNTSGVNQRKVILGFLPGYAAREFDIDFGARYHADPVYRSSQDKKSAQRFYERFGQYGLGSPQPDDTKSVGIQPLDFLNNALGGLIEYKKDESPWTPEKPLGHIQRLSDILAMPDIDWDNNPVWQDQLRQYDILCRLYGKDEINWVQFVGKAGERGEESLFIIHTPYTTAFRLLGENLFEFMLCEPEIAQAVFEYIMRQYENLKEKINTLTGWRTPSIHFGDCAATMLSPDLYRQLSLPLYEKIMTQYKSCVIHSCGCSSHLLELFAEIPGVRELQLGFGTDLVKTRELFPQVLIMAYFDPGVLSSAAPAQIRGKVLRMAAELKDNFIISASEIDPNTPSANLLAYWDAAKEIN